MLATDDARILVDLDRAVRVELDAGLLQAQAAGVGRAADGEHHRVGFERRAVRRGDATSAVAGLLDAPRRSCAAARSDARACACLGIEASRTSSSKPRSTFVAAIDERRLDAEAVEDAGELDRDVAAADDHDALRQRSRWNASLEVMACSTPGHAPATPGVPPVAIRIVPRRHRAARPASSTVFGSTSRRASWISSTPAFSRLRR